jgi:hypothetical protein
VYLGERARMLEEYRLIYEEVASTSIPDWRSRDKNDLIIKACDLPNGPEKDSYISAILLKYWNKINKFYAKCKLVATPEDVHTWLTMAVLYAMDNKPWENPESSIYMDKNGPDKVINRVMECRRITFYQQLNRYNRKINSAILSLDSLTEDFKDTVFPIYEDSKIIEIFDVVCAKFKEEEYMMAFILDAIICEGLRNREEDYRKFVTHIRRMNKSFCQNFSSRYGIPNEDVIYAVEKVHLLSNVDLRKRVEYNLIRLKSVLKE